MTKEDKQLEKNRRRTNYHPEVYFLKVLKTKIRRPLHTRLRVSRFYLADTFDQQNFTNLKPVSYTQASPVKFPIEAGEGYTLLVPPNLDSEYWELDGTTSFTQGFYAVYPASKGMIYYRRFDTYLLGYAVSLMTLLGL